jgi:hypothetical protein
VEGSQVTRRLALAVCAACSSRAPAAPTPLAASGVAATGAATSSSCNGSEFHQFDFWIGDWELVVHARTTPTGNKWADARGRQHVESILGGCAIAEHFSADGPPKPWAGASYSAWQPQLARWRQTWVDDSGGYIALDGGIEHGAMTLYGEPRDVDGVHTQMRMVFRDVAADSLRWEWQRTEDGWETATSMIIIDYKRSVKHE